MMFKKPKTAEDRQTRALIQIIAMIFGLTAFVVFIIVTLIKAWF